MKYVAFLRGINVGKHRIPMADLKKQMEGFGFSNVRTLLNTGNVIFRSENTDVQEKRRGLFLQLY